MKQAQLDVRLVASTQIHVAMGDATGWTDPGDYTSDGEWLVEFAGRACYQSWKRPNPQTATNRGYIAHILDVGHMSVIEHASASFYIQGVSRSLTHELVRHRHFSYSQLSQRFVKLGDAAYVLPPALDGREEGIEGLENFLEATTELYQQLLEGLEEDLKDQRGLTDTRRKKIARETARSILANCTETKLVMTGNLRAWRHFISLRATEHADAEIRNLALEVLDLLTAEFPSVFADFRHLTLPDGTVVAYTKTEGQ